MSTNRVLFILKRREDYSAELHSYVGLSTGLFNSANYMNEMLNENGVTSIIEVAIDNNCIDRLVTKHKPTHVIIEALWVVPEKFQILSKLHPNVEWIIRLHSEVPFISLEGMAMGWIHDYLKYPNVKIGINAPRMMESARAYLKNCYDDTFVDSLLIYLPNYYPLPRSRKRIDFDKPEIHISCFGAIRPLKNHLIQAIAAVEFANRVDKTLHFHINGNRIEQKADPILRNLDEMFQRLAITGRKHRLIKHDWAPRDEFLKICAQIDIGMQVSFSETFNIVAADLIGQGVPVVGTDEIPWLAAISCADATETDSMMDALNRAYHAPELNVMLNRRNLKKYAERTERTWVKYFGD